MWVLPHLMFQVGNDVYIFKRNFLWMGFNYLKLELLRGGSLLFTTKFPEIHDTPFIDLGKMKG